MGHMAKRHLIGAGALVILVGFGPQAIALGLGDASVASTLGQTLQMTVPLGADPGVELSQDCVRLVPSNQPGDALPGLGTGRVTIEAERGQLRIESLQPINEPILRVVVEVGCAQRIRREFTLLLDPPAVPSLAADGSAIGSSEPGRVAPSLGLGMAQISAVLGRPLSLKVPVTGADAGNLTADCVRLSDPISSEGAPVLRQATIKVVQQETGSVVELVTPDPVTEPAVRLALDVGCIDPLRREYAILLGLPPLAASDASNTTAVAPEQAPPRPPAPHVPKRPARAPDVTAVPVAPTPASAAIKPTPVARVEPSAQKSQAPSAGADRLVLSAPTEHAAPGAPSADAQAAQNVELLSRLETMTKQIEALQNELVLSRQREQDMERRLSEARDGWAWLIGAAGGVLLGGAVVFAWRQRRAPAPTWEPISAVTRPPVEPMVVKTAPRAAPANVTAPGIGGRGTMAPAPTTISASTEPPVLERHSEITVTELHDTVQIIKELYATVLERNTSNANTMPVTQRRDRPLDLDLRPSAGVAAQVAQPPRAPGQAARSERPPGAHERNTQASPDEERFTELPTEAGLDLDLSSRIVPGEPFTPDPEPAGAAQTTPQASPPIVADSLPVPAAHAVVAPRFADDQLTQTPTEVSIDIDIGEPSHLANTVGQPITRVVPRLHPEPERPRDTVPATLTPFDLQLDLDQPETGTGAPKPRKEKSA